MDLYAFRAVSPLQLYSHLRPDNPVLWRAAVRTAGSVATRVHKFKHCVPKREFQRAANCFSICTSHAI